MIICKTINQVLHENDDREATIHYLQYVIVILVRQLGEVNKKDGFSFKI